MSPGVPGGGGGMGAEQFDRRISQTSFLIFQLQKNRLLQSAAKIAFRCYKVRQMMLNFMAAHFVTK